MPDYLEEKIKETVDDSPWLELAHEYARGHFFELRTGIFGDKGLTDAMRYQQTAVAKDLNVEDVMNDALSDATQKLEKAKGKELRLAKRELRRIARALRWLHPNDLQKLNLNKYRDKDQVGETVYLAVRKLISKALYSVEKIDVEKARLIYSVYAKESAKQKEPSEAELNEWIKALDIIDDRETHVA